MPCGWEGKRRSGVALAMRQTLVVLYLRVQGLGEEDEHPPTLSCRAWSTFLYPHTSRIYRWSGDSDRKVSRRRRCFWHTTQNCVAPYVDHILHRDRFWVISIASGNVSSWNLKILLYGAQPCDAGASSRSLEGELTGSSWHLRVVHMHNVPSKGQAT